MKNCNSKVQIEDYLFNRLDEDKKEEFEEHYFNCPSCFKKMAERNELIAIVKSKGQTIFKDEYIAEAAKGETWLEKITSFLTPRQWALSTVSAALLLVAIFYVIPNLKTTTPQFYINEDAFTVRTGNKIILIPPVIDMKTVPSKFEWVKLERENIEYIVYIYDNGDMLWSKTTKDNFIDLPEHIKLLMTPGEKYSWQVKAFSPEGTIISISGRVRFIIQKIE
ncbi:MAG: hypothetical protein GQ536_01955 [Candidatus Aminicenantes bacterium]|nr:hypothetical protein [Candidatus Aminicenantes bacterium]